MARSTEIKIACNFCGRGKDEARLVAGPFCYICEHCVAMCNEILADGASPAGSEHLSAEE